RRLIFSPGSSLGTDEPSPLLHPEVSFPALNHAGVAVPNAAHALAGRPPDIQDLVHRVLVALVKLNLQRPQFPVCVKPDDDRHISLFTLHRCYPPKYPTGWTV